MPKSLPNPKLDPFFHKAKRWKKEMEALREIALACGLTEQVKWDQPCYTFEKQNVAIIGEYKEYCVFSFFKGVLLTDPKEVLSKPGPNSRSARVLYFTNLRDITRLKPTIQAFIKEAIENEKAGRKVDFAKDRKPAHIPFELEEKFEEMPEFREAFNALTPGRQRGYILYFEDAKQSRTRTARIEKYMDLIFEGVGIHDEYLAQAKSMKKKKK